jgi:nucleoside phosphorylase/DNA-binding response OmpR family regulator
MKVRILVVDDDENVLREIQQSLAGLPNYEVVPARNAVEALNELGRGGIDLIVVDYLLGSPLQGDELIRIIRREASYRHVYSETPIILMTGSKGEAELKLSMVSLGVETHLKKDGWGILLTKIFSLLPDNGTDGRGDRLGEAEAAVGDPSYVYEGCEWYNPELPHMKEGTESEISQHEFKIALITATQTELKQVLFKLLPLKGKKSIYRLHKDMETYYFGRFGKFNAVVAKCELGAISPLSSAQTTRSVIEDWNPKALIMVGIAFGKDMEKQRPGDVVVATQLILYELQRVGRDDSIFRGQIPSTGLTLINRFCNVIGWEFRRPDGSRVEMHPGPMLTGEKLVDNPKVKKELFDKYKQAIAGEMEGAGVYASSIRNKIDWILVKGIADWGDGKKHHKYQQMASAAATDLALYVMNDESALSGL